MATVVPTISMRAHVVGEVVVRFYDKTSDVEKVLALEQKCEAGENGNDMTLLQNLLGDPLSRVRHYSTYTMLVAEVNCEIVGVIRAGIKNVVCRMRQGESIQAGSRGSTSYCEDEAAPVHARVAYLLGLRVSPLHRRMGIGLKLALRIEEWCKEQGAEYTYFATTKDNEPSLKLFTRRLQYIPFRYPALVGHPVWHHSVRLPSHIQVTKLSVEAAVAMYRSVMRTEEFFPEDIDKILNHKLCAGTWVATVREDRRWNSCCGGGSCRVSENLGTIESSFTSVSNDDCRPMPESWAVISLWKCNEIFTMQLKGAPLHKRTGALISRCVDKMLPWCGVPSFPDIFNPFGVQFMFGLHAEGPRGPELFRWLCRHAHNVSRKDGCQVLMTEVGETDPLRPYIPRWEKFSSDDDVWCAKKIVQDGKDVSCRGCSSNGSNRKTVGVAAAASVHDTVYDWCQLSPSRACRMFIDPRDV
ncbi:hypothetical protein R1sor_014102 [Riccia sorocarpa]|uniref:N-acetyltransferase domain-containing protein n=1 Tax=Riccia sorocarpa TaxID=122646 RepID=A0ABD3H8M3_9MARC